MKRTLDFLDSGALEFAAPLLRAERMAGEAPEPFAEFVGQLIDDVLEPPLPPGGLPVGSESPYVLEHRLARGGMATVYLARDTKHDRRVAIKVLDPGLTAGLGTERFVREIHLAARLQHPHVLGLLDSGVFGPEAGRFAGRPYYAMPFVEGESLRARLARGPVARSDAVRVLREVADALAYAHEQGVIHRDIKPENILLSRAHAVVADFGIATALAASQGDAAFAGTPRYMAPEQALEGALVDQRADLYAWAVMAYELLAGSHPFQDTVVEARETPPPLRQLAPDLPVPIAAIVTQCLAKRAVERPASAATILAALDAANTAGTSRVFEVSLPRFGGGLTVATLLLIALIGAWIGGTHRRGRESLVVGSGDALRDVKAIQAAVDRGGDVTIQGRFSFAAPPTKPVAAVLASGIYPAAAQILIARSVSISGIRDARGEMATIESGTVPFYVDAPGERVRIRGLRFVRPRSAAILVRSVDGFEVSHSRIDGLVPFPTLAEGIALSTHGWPMPSSAGNPEDVAGRILIANNHIDGTGGRADAATEGISLFSIGQSPRREVTVDIIANDITNTSSATINIRGVGGAVRIIGNTLRTSSETRGDVDAVRLVNAKSLLMATNTVESKWPNAAAIQVFSPFAEWQTRHAIIEDNDVLMSPSPGAALGEFDAGISIRGYTDGVVVRHNRISGRARSALSMYAFRGGVPADNAFIDNRVERFEATLADIFIGTLVARTRISGPGTVLDRGTGTMRSP